MSEIKLTYTRKLPGWLHRHYCYICRSPLFFVLNGGDKETGRPNMPMMLPISHVYYCAKCKRAWTPDVWGNLNNFSDGEMQEDKEWTHFYLHETRPANSEKKEAKK